MRIDVKAREHPYAHEAALTLYVAGDAYQGRTDNVSRGGLCATLAIGEREAFPSGTDVELDIQLVFEEDLQSEPLRLPARVVWCTAVDEAHQVGIAFKPLPSDLAQYLTMFLRFLDDGTKPARLKRESTLDKRFG